MSSKSLKFLQSLERSGSNGSRDKSLVQKKKKEREREDNKRACAWSESTAVLTRHEKSERGRRNTRTHAIPPNDEKSTSVGSHLRDTRQPLFSQNAQRKRVNLMRHRAPRTGTLRVVYTASLKCQCVRAGFIDVAGNNLWHGAPRSRPRFSTARVQAAVRMSARIKQYATRPLNAPPNDTRSARYRVERESLKLRSRGKSIST